MRSISAGVIFPIYLDTSLGSPEWDVHNGALVRHECGQSLYLILVHIVSKPNPTLGWKLVVTMFGTPRLNYFN